VSFRITSPVLLGLLAVSLHACSGCDDDPTGGGGVATIWLAVDGSADVYLDGEHVGEAEGWNEATVIDVALVPGGHALTLQVASEGDGAVALWTRLPDGELLTTSEEWRVLDSTPPDCWHSGDCVDEGSPVAVGGSFGSWPWSWRPLEMEGTGARWLLAPDREGWLGTQFLLGDHRTDVWTVSPTTAVSGENTPLTFTFVAGSAGVGVGEVRKLFHTPLDGGWGRGMPYPRWTAWQIDDPSEPGYLRVVSAPDGVEASLSVAQSSSEEETPGPHVTGGRLEARLAIAGQALQPGDEVVVSWGEGESEVLPPVQARRHYFPHTSSEAEASMDYPEATLGSSPFVDVVAGGAEGVHLAFRGGSAVSTEGQATLQLVVVDDVGNPVVGFTGTLQIEVGGSLQTVELDPVERGSTTVEVSVAETGMHRAVVSGDLRGSDAWLWVTDGPPTWQLFFGDFHGHTLASDGIWTAEASYRHADEVAGLDFAAVSDHAERLTDSEWDAAVRLAGDLSRGDFVVLAGYEWTGRTAEHRCVYSLDGEPLARTGSFGYTADPLEDVLELWDLVGDEALIVPHHPGSLVGPEHLWVDHDPALEPVVEIYSKHGSSECYGCEPSIDGDWALAEGNYVQDALADGLRFGFVASGDGHEVPLGGMEPDHEVAFGAGDYGPMVRRGGVTGVWAEELNTAGLLDAIRARRTYATTGPRILLRLEIDGHPMGSEFQTDAGPRVRAAVGGTESLRRVEVVRFSASDGFTTPFAVDSPGQPFEIDWTDEEITEDALYYLRVTQEDGHRAWSSPIWVDRG